MAQSAPMDLSIHRELNPEVDQLTNRLMLSMIGQNGKFKSDEWKVISEVLNYAAEAEQRLIEQGRRISHLEALSMTDELTGLANRRALKEFMTRTLSAAKRYNENGTLVFIDVDNFKAVNDTFGHDAGDCVLRYIASFLVNNTRTSDVVIRLGGDEFVVVLVRCKAEQGRERAGKLMDSLNDLVVPYGKIRIPVSATVGSEPYGPKSRYADVLRRADHRMLANKKNGHGKMLTAVAL